MLETMVKRDGLEISEPVRIETLDDLISVVRGNSETGDEDQEELLDSLKMCRTLEEGIDLIQQFTLSNAEKAMRNSELSAIFKSQFLTGRMFEERLNTISRLKKPASQKIQLLLQLESEMNQANQPYPEERFVFWTGDRDELDRLAYQRFARTRTILLESMPYGRLYELLTELYGKNRDEENRIHALKNRRLHDKGNASVLLDLAAYWTKKGKLEEAWDALKDAYSIVWKADDIKKLWVLLFRYFQKAEKPELANYSFLIADALNGPLTKKESSEMVPVVDRMSNNELNRIARELADLLEANSDFFINQDVFILLYERVLLKNQLLGRSGSGIYNTDASVGQLNSISKKTRTERIEIGRRAQASIDALLNTRLGGAVWNFIDVNFHIH